MSWQNWPAMRGCSCSSAAGSVECWRSAGRHCATTLPWALGENASPLLGYLEPEGDHLVFRFLPGGDPGQWRFSEELTTAVAALGGQIACKDLDDAVGICMTLPLGGESCG